MLVTQFSRQREVLEAALQLRFVLTLELESLMSYNALVINLQLCALDEIESKFLWSILAT